MKVNDRQFIELYRRNTPQDQLGLMHLCFDTGDMEGLVAAYQSRGLKPTATRKARAGNLLFTMNDPEGQLLEYTQYLPDSLHWNERGKHLAEARISDHMIRAASQAKDMESLRAFYATKLLCEQRKGSGPVRMVLPDKFHEEVELDAASADWKPRLTFAVADVRRAQDELRKRGLSPRPGAASSVAVTDPDGVTVVFVAEPAEEAVPVFPVKQLLRGGRNRAARLWRDELQSARLLVLSDVLADPVNVVVEAGRVFVSDAPDFLDNWIY